MTSEIRDGSHRVQYVKLRVLPMRCPLSMPDFPTEVGRMPYLAAWRHPGTCISLRVPAQRTFSLQDCVASGALTPGAAKLLTRMIEAKLAF